MYVAHSSGSTAPLRTPPDVPLAVTPRLPLAQRKDARSYPKAEIRV